MALKLKQSEKDAELRKMLTPEFLYQLVMVAGYYGWDGDFVEIKEFVVELHKRVGQTIDFEPIEIEDYHGSKE